MTNQEIDIAIAEACGWTKVRQLHGVNPPEWVWKNENGSMRGQGCIPRYHSDLNAMFAAEETLTRHQQADMLNELTKIVAIDDSGYAFHANARQRATAFLIVKWKG